VAVDEFEAWVQARSPQLARAAYLLTGDVHLAQDLLQDTLARVADHWTGLARRGAPDAYARRVMYHLSVDWWRRRRSRPQLVLEPPKELAAPGGDEESVVRRLALREALMRLTTKQRAVLVLRFFEDCTEAQAADLLGCSVSTVKSQTRHALNRLRQLAPDLVELPSASAEVSAP
jgi:RNA polymerase sigma-70 factor (sigma-E family)